MIDPTWVSAGAACFAAAVGAIAATSGVRTLRQTRRDSKARNRPMMVAELQRVPYVRGTQKLVLSNYGPTIAKNIWVTFDPLLPDPPAEKAPHSVTPFLKRRYSRKIAVMPPNMKLENVYFSGRPGQDGKWENDEPVPDRVTVRIVYEDSVGHSYRDVFHLDVDLVRDATEATSSGAPDAQIKEIAKALKAIEKRMG